MKSRTAVWRKNGEQVFSSAVFSDCMRYRYRLWRSWSGNENRCLFVMLNPSTADEVQNDPTVERCERRARGWGYSGFEVVNIFALRSTDPKGLYRTKDPIGPDNDEAIVQAARNATMIVCAWGSHGRHRGRGDAVIDLLSGRRLHALRVNQDGSPAHPLYLPYAAQPIRYLPDGILTPL